MPPRFGVPVVAGELPLAFEPELDRCRTTAARGRRPRSAAMTSTDVVLLHAHVPLLRRTTGVGSAHCVQHTGLDVTPRRPPVGSRRPGGPQAVVADGGRLAGPADHQRRERAGRAAHGAAPRRARRSQPLARAGGAAHPGGRGAGRDHAAPRRASRARRGARRPRAVRVPAAAGAALRVSRRWRRSRRSWRGRTRSDPAAMEAAAPDGRRLPDRERDLLPPARRSTARTRCCASSSS